MDFLPKNLTGPYCATEDVWNWKNSQLPQKMLGSKRQSNCVIDGLCDIPATRNMWRGRHANISLVFNLVCPTMGTGNCPLDTIDFVGQIDQINKDFAGTGIHFDVFDVNRMYDSRLADISAYGAGNQWYNDIREIKQKMAFKPQENINFFISKQKSGFSGTLLGIGTFPWDPEAQTEFGGLWVNANYFGAGQKCAAHEIGHNIGLWHAFHGTAEVACASPCYEPVHNETDPTSLPNFIGDFCADTMSQPVNYACSPPTSTDCRGARYDNLDRDLIPDLHNNVMAYTFINTPTCQTKFTIQQSSRAHCWICDRFSKWFLQGQCNIN